MLIPPLFFALVLCIASGPSSGHAADTPPHILLVLADDFGFHDIGYHGSEINTKVMDSLAESGVKLTNYYVQPLCSPSRSQLMTGKYQIHTGLQHRQLNPDQPNGLPLGIPTLADRLRDTGYATHMVGKWHLGFYRKQYTPLYRGFDSFYGFYSGGEDHFTHQHCWEYKNYGKACGLDLWNNEEPVYNNTEYNTNLFVQRSKNIIENHVKNSTKPLFLYLALESVHTPRQAPEQYLKPYEWIISEKRRQYAGMVAVMDEAIGNVTNALKEQGLWDNTLMIFSNDNGGPADNGANNWPLRGEKGTLWEGGIHGLGFVSGGLLEPQRRGTTTKELIHISDWFPTLLHVAGADVSSDELDGHNVWNTISAGSPSPREEILHNIDPLASPIGNNLFPGTFDVRTRAAIRHKHVKLLTGFPGKDHWHNLPNLTSQDHYEYVFENDPLKNVYLFNITEDPNERHDISYEHSDVVEFLVGRLRYYHGTMVKCRYPPQDPHSNPELPKQEGLWQAWRGSGKWPGPYAKKPEDSNTTAQIVVAHHPIHMSTVVMEVAAVLVAIVIICWFAVRLHRHYLDVRHRRWSRGRRISRAIMGPNFDKHSTNRSRLTSQLSAQSVP